ncbi:MAG: type II toxin-antitoxin system prevent-host-death family antitoxin, partial [Alphaproteobacteria bacterium]|jgi:prevent-host-death family protein|nr:type II toxin-antitoxin system prevent-host-death family antitoxin [Alphaproteobacteria bacterium]
MPSEDHITIRELRGHLAEHLRHVRAGGSVTITSHGQPVARLVPVASLAPRRAGFMRGEFTIPKDFDDPLQDMDASIAAPLMPRK